LRVCVRRGFMRKVVVLLTALAVVTSLVVGPTHESVLASSVPMRAPVSAEYLAAQAGNVLPAVAGRPLGFAPSPVDMSHLTSSQSSGQDALGAPAQYDLRTLPGRLSPVRDQGTCGCCWAFAAYGSLESVALPVEQWDFSEQNLKNLSGFDWGPCVGGNAQMAIAYMARWAGPVRETDDPYNPTVSTSPAGLTVSRYLSAALAIPDRKNALDNAALKSAVQQWGAVQTSMYWTVGSYKDGPHSYYYDGSGTSNHEVAIVGWDDSYSHLNFKTAPAGDGAFIVKNSWGTGWGDGGYFYVSYYDTVFGRDNWVFVLGTGTPMDTHNYGYDDLGWVANFGLGGPTAWGANVFTLNAGNGSEVIDRVGFYTTDTETSYTLRIYGTVAGAVFSNKLTEESGAFDEAGYHTVSLASPVTVAHGQKIAVAIGMTTSSPHFFYPLAYECAEATYSSAAVAAAGQSYYGSSGSSWSDLTSSDRTANLCIRAFTHDAVPSAPSAPVLSSPADHSTAGSLTPILAWCAAAGATSYTVEVNSDIAFFFPPQFTQSGVTGTSITTTSLPPGTDFYWRVNATNAVGTSAWSSTWSFTTPAALEIPVVPSLLSPPSGQVTSSLAPTLTWAVSARATSYTVELSRFDYFPTLVWSQSTTGTSVTTPTLAPSTLYFWHVRATNAAGSITSVQHNFTTPAAVTPLAPVLFSPADGTTLGSLTPTLTWAIAAGAASYTVQASLSSTFVSTPEFSQSGIEGTSTTTLTLAGGTIHYWRVNATNAAGTSSWSSTWSFTTLPAYTLTPSAGAGGTITPITPQTILQGGSTTFTITPSTGYHILDVLVDSDSAGAVATYTFTNVQTNHTINATFAPDAYTLTVTPPVNGTVTKSPDQATYAYGTSVTLTATPAAGYTFTVWTGNLSGTTNPATITMTSNKTVTATFTALPTYTLSTTASPSQGGTIGKSPNQSSYLSGTVVTLTAIPAAGYTFTVWTGNLSGTTNPATVTMTSNKAVTATFTALPTYTLSTTASPSAGGTIAKSPNQSSYPSGTVVTLTATPLAGYTFTGWSGGDLTGTTNPATITMSANKAVTATFTAIPTYTLSTTASPSAGGTIAKSPNQSSYLSGTVVTLTATPLAGYTFTGWSGDLTGSTNPATITMSANKAVTATFTPVSTYTLTVTPPINGTVTKNPDQVTYTYGASVTLTATPGSGYAFTGWSGDLTGSTNPATITMNANRTVAATFLALGPGSVYVVATLDGASWSGEVQFSLTDGTSVITGSSVPFHMDEVNPGSFTIDATGGPAGKVLRYAPNKTQHVTSGLGTTFILEYWSEATEPGDLAITAPLPGDVAGSSVSVEGLAYGCPPGSLLTVTARVLPLGVPVTVISNMQIDVTPMTWSGTLTAAALGLTAGGDVEIVARLTGFPSGTEARVLIHWTPAGARILALLPGWNLVGVSSPLPLVAVPGFMQCFGYQNGWSVLGTGDVLQPGLGYWLQVADAVDVVLPGLETSGPVSVTYEAGWQLLGNPYSVPVPVASITHWNVVTTCFLYGPAWGSVDLLTGNLEPGRGYWINLTAATTLTLTRP
jgi:uncharacterized repeat protein (TIGR02543 family)